MKSNLNYLTKIILICSSTIVYMALSSFLISSCIFHLKNQLTLLNTSKDLVLQNNSTHSTIFSNLVVTKSNEFILETNEFDTANNETKLNDKNSNFTFYETFCSMNEKLSTSIFKLFETNKQKRNDLVDLMRQNQNSYHHYPINSLINQFILK